MRVKVDRQREGGIPSEAVVAIPTITGDEEVVVHTSQVDEKGLEVGFIREVGDRMLIELPRETVSGRWRVWIPRSAVAA
jgi:hypothetical protein